MKNAHLRLGSLLFQKHSESRNASTNVKTWCDRYACDNTQLHIASFFGSDTEMAAFSAAIQEGRQLGVEFPGHNTFHLAMGENAKCYKSQLQVPGRKRKLVHIVAVSEAVQLNGSQECVYCLNDAPQVVWDTLVHVLGLPGAPAWADWIHDQLKAGKKIEPLRSVGMKAVRVNANRFDLMRLIRKGLLKNKLLFPETNAPLPFQARTIPDLLDTEDDAYIVVAA